MDCNAAPGRIVHVVVSGLERRLSDDVATTR